MRIALTGSGTATSTGFFKAIRMSHADTVDLIGLDMNPMNSCIPFVNLSVRVPRLDDPSYSSYLADLCSKLEIDLLLPILDPEFITFRTHKHLFASRIFLPEYSWRMTDKFECDNIIQHAACQAPTTRTGATGKKLIWKPRFGAASAGIKIIMSAEDIPTEEGLLQDYIDGQEHTVDFIAFGGELCAGAQRTRIMTRGGVSTIAKVSPLATDVRAQLERLIEYVHYEGPGCFQFIRDPGGTIYWTDLNPRVGGGTMLTVAAGLNIPAMFIDMLISNERPPPVEISECHVVRYFEEYVT